MLLRLQAGLHARSSFLRPLVPAVRGAELREADGARRSAGPRGARHRRAGQDWLSGRPQAAARRRAGDRHDAVPAQFGGALRPRTGFRGLGGPARDLRARSPAHAERGSAVPRAARHAQPAGLHRQQRVPDGPASAGVLRAHDGGRNGGSAWDAGARAKAARRVRDAARRADARRRRRRRPPRSAGAARICPA